MSATASPLATAGAPAQERSLIDHPLVPWALVAVGLYGVYGNGDLVTALRDFRLTDSDDAMRLVEVRNLVAGQSWFDMVEHRFLPPAGVASHWSRLLDAPLAAAITALTPLVGASLAERITCAFWPPLLALIFAVITVRGLAGLFPKRAALFALFAATQTPALALQFAPGRIDHHNVQILLLLGTGFLLMRPAPDWRRGALAGALSALSMAIGLEALPLIGLAGLLLAGEWCWQGRPALPAFVAFGASLGACALGFFALQTAPALWTVEACDALSPPWLWLAGTGSMVAAAAALVRPEQRLARLGLLAAVGTLGLAGFLFLFPACLGGPFLGMPELVRTRWLDQVLEMQPLSTLIANKPADGLGYAASLYIALAAAIVLAVVDEARRRALLVLALFLAVGALQVAAHLRGIYVAVAFLPPIAGLVLDRALTGKGTPAARALCIAAVLLLDSKVWLAGGKLVERAVAHEAPLTASTAEGCLSSASLRPLDALAPGTVLAPIDLGPFLLTHTHHSVVAAPYHRGPAGLSASIRAFEGNEADLRREMAATGAAYLVACPSPVDTGFAADLARGKASAEWLEPVPLPAEAVLKAWRLR